VPHAVVPLGSVERGRQFEDAWPALEQTLEVRVRDNDVVAERPCDERTRENGSPYAACSTPNRPTEIEERRTRVRFHGRPALVLPMSPVLTEHISL
jgi:hypothetical protein